MLSLGVSSAASLLTRAGDGVRPLPSELPLRHFEPVYQSFGSLLVPGCLAVRAVLTFALPARGARGRVASLLVPGIMYGMLAVLRAGVYVLHSSGMILSSRRWRARGETHHVMSDHILLAASVISGLGSEAALAVLSWEPTLAPRGAAPAAQHARSLPHDLAAATYTLSVSALALLVCTESYFTARYFHPRVESAVAMVMGVVLFQAPSLMFNIRVLQATQAHRPQRVEARTDGKSAVQHVEVEGGAAARAGQRSTARHPRQARAHRDAD